MDLRTKPAFLIPALALVALALVSPLAQAQVSAVYPATSSQGSLQERGMLRPLSIGAAYGVSHTELPCDGSSACDRSDRGFKLHAAYDLTLYAAVELGYLNFGEARDQIPQSGAFGPIPVSGLIDERYSAKAWYAAIALHTPLVGALDGTLRLGVAKVRTKVANTITLAGVALPESSASESHYTPYYGLALGYALTPQLKLVAAADFSQAEFNHETQSVRLISLGGQLNF
jgi:OOP family OmpA-OmpF porin